METLEALGVLVAREPEGVLYQAFTRPLHDRPTFFTEIIQRDGALGFGSDNIKALFRALEREHQRAAWQLQGERA
jgi:4-hydroxyphenylpyruvate dioxygenase